MGEKDRQNELFEKLKNKLMADKKVLILIAFGVLGMALLLFTENRTEPKVNEDEPTSCEITAFSDYEAELTHKIADIVSSVSGAGSVKVLLTLESYEEYVYAQDSEVLKNKSDENSNIEEKKSYIIIDNDKLQGKGGMLIKVITPRVRGVGVVCDGGGSAVVRREITAILCSALDIGASKVHIAARQSSS